MSSKCAHGLAPGTADMAHCVWRSDTVDRNRLIKWAYSHEDMKELACMSFTSRGNNEILVAGLQDRMFTIDVEKGAITRQVY